MKQASGRGARILGVQCMEISLGYGKSNSAAETHSNKQILQIQKQGGCLSKEGSWSGPQTVLGNDIWNGSMNQLAKRSNEMSSIRSDCVWGYCEGKWKCQPLGMWTGVSEPNHCAGKPD